MAMDMGSMMRQARKMQSEMETAQTELAAKQYTRTAGGGAVEATVSGKMQLVSLKIDPEAVDPSDVDMLQDMVMAAVNGALTDAQTATQQRMESIAGGLNIPGM